MAKCPQCKLAHISPATGECEICGYKLPAPSPIVRESAPPPPDAGAHDEPGIFDRIMPAAQEDASPYAEPVKRVPGLGIASLIAGSAGVLLCWVPLAGHVLGLAGFIMGFVSALRTRRAVAVIGTSVSVVSLVLAPVFLARLLLYQFIEVPEIEPATIQEAGLAAAVEVCDMLLAQSRMQGIEFTCAGADAQMVANDILTISIADHGPGACLITVTASGSSQPSTQLWTYEQ